MSKSLSKYRPNDFCGRDKFVHPLSKPEQPLYGMVFDKESGRVKPGVKGIQNWQEQINSYLEGTELHSVIQMIQNGRIPQSQIDQYIKQVDEEGFVDITGVPRSMVEVSELNYRTSELYN